MPDGRARAKLDEADAGDALARLRTYLDTSRRQGDLRLPSERELAQRLGVSRNVLRKSLAVLEDEGLLWRHVGKGTFLGEGPPEVLDIGDLARRSNPMHVMRARHGVEPELARLAAINATAEDIALLVEINHACRNSPTWRIYEVNDARFHLQLAEAAHNPVLLALLKTVNAVRRALIWGRPRPGDARPPADHHSFDEHDRIVDAIRNREPAQAAAAMKLHLQVVEDRLNGR